MKRCWIILFVVIFLSVVTVCYSWLQGNLASVLTKEPQMRTPTPHVIVEEERCVITNRVEKVGLGTSNASKTLGSYGQGVKISSWSRHPEPTQYPSFKVEMDDPVESFGDSGSHLFSKKIEE